MQDVEPGYNTDILCSGLTYHVQTEDWGETNPFVVTRVFHSGSVVVSMKTPYEKIVELSLNTGRQAVRLGMREQHQKVLDQLVSGTLFNTSIK